MKLRLIFLFAISASLAWAQTAKTPADSNGAPAVPVLQIDAGQVTGNVSPTLYGLMTEEINYSYEGGLYGELVRNRSFMTNPNWPIYWQVVGNPSVVLDRNQPLNTALNVSLKMDASTASKNAPEGIANGGFWGIPVRRNTAYRASFYAKSDNFHGPLTVALVSAWDGAIIASAKVPIVSSKWRKYAVRLKTKNVPTSRDNVFEIFTTTPGIVWFQEVSLFPPTFDNQPNGFRPDIME
ncbi:MAG: alpha-L-arabinofuranosidase C-terminal domain-containing protein, partial [Limisphaerales bacterium]